MAVDWRLPASILQHANDTTTTGTTKTVFSISITFTPFSVFVSAFRKSLNQFDIPGGRLPGNAPVIFERSLLCCCVFVGFYAGAVRRWSAKGGKETDYDQDSFLQPPQLQEMNCLDHFVIVLPKPVLRSINPTHPFGDSLAALRPIGILA